MENLKYELLEFIKWRSKVNTNDLLGLIMANDDIHELVEYLDDEILRVFTNSDGVNVIIMLDEKYISLLGILLVDPSNINKKYLVITSDSILFKINLNHYTNITHICINILGGTCSSTSFNELDIFEHDNHKYDIINEKLDDKYDELYILDYNNDDILCTIGSPRYKLTFKKKVINTITNKNSINYDEELVPCGIYRALDLYLRNNIITPINYKNLKDLSKKELEELTGIDELEGLSIQKLIFFWKCYDIGLDQLAHFMDIANSKLIELDKIKPITVIPENTRIDTIGTSKFIFTSNTTFQHLNDLVKYIDVEYDGITNITFVIPVLSDIDDNNLYKNVMTKLRTLYTYKFKLIVINLVEYIDYKKREVCNQFTFDLVNCINTPVDETDDYKLYIESLFNENELVKCNIDYMKVHLINDSIKFTYYNGNKTCGLVFKLERKNKNGEI